MQQRRFFPAHPGLHVRRTASGFEVPVHHMRGGTSTGIVLWEGFVPDARPQREELVRRIMGLPLSGEVAANRQTTGLGRGTPTSNKVFFAGIETVPGGVRLVSELAQAAARTAAIDWSVNCGNMSAALQLWALDTGLLAMPTAPGVSEVAIRNLNTAIVSTSRMAPDARGGFEPAAIPGVLGEHPGVDLFLHDPVGNKTGALLLPTGQATDIIAGVRASCVDVAVPMVIVDAAELGCDGTETPDALDADTALLQRLRTIRIEAGLRMALRRADGTPMDAAALAASETVPKMCLVSPPRAGGAITARYFTPQVAHPSIAVSGACCLAASCLIEGSVAADLAQGVAQLDPVWREIEVGIENPAGLLVARVETRTISGGLPEISRVAYRRSAQVLIRGLVPVDQPSEALAAMLAARL